MELLPIRRRACGLGLWGRCSSGKLRMASRSHEAPGPLRSVAVAASQSALSSVVGDRGRAVVCLSLGSPQSLRSLLHANAFTSREGAARPARLRRRCA